MARCVNHVTLFLLSTYSAYAALPYSIPDLDDRRWFSRRAERTAYSHSASTYQNFLLSASPSRTASHQAPLATLPPTVPGSEAHSWSSTVPFPIFLNSTSTRSGFVSSESHVWSSALSTTASTNSTSSILGLPSSESSKISTTASFPTLPNSTLAESAILGSKSHIWSSTSLVTTFLNATISGSTTVIESGRLSSLSSITPSDVTTLSSLSLSSSALESSDLTEISPSPSLKSLVSSSATSGSSKNDGFTFITTVTASDGAPSIITLTATVTPTAPVSHGISATQPATEPPDTVTVGMPSKPPETSPPAGGEPFFKFPPPFILDVLIDGQAYHLPSPRESWLSILLRDGAIAQLSSDKVVIRGQTLPIPATLSGAQVISSGGQSITAQPGQSKKPDSGGHGGGGGGGGNPVGKLLHGLAKAAGGAAGGLAKAEKGALDFASGAGGTAAGLADTFSGVAGDVGGLVSSLNGIQQAFPAAQLSKAGLGATMNALNLGRDASNWLNSMNNLAQGFDSLAPDVQQQARGNMQQFAGPGGPLEQASKAMKAFSDYPWDKENPTTQNPATQNPATQNPATQNPATQNPATQNPATQNPATQNPNTQNPTAQEPTASATQQPDKSVHPTNTASVGTSYDTADTTAFSTTTSALATQTPSSSSSSAGSPKETLSTYYICTKSGTSLDIFNKFIKELDGGAGEADTYDPAIIPYQAYMTKLLPSQADSLEAKYDFVLSVHNFTFHPEDVESIEEFHALPRQSKPSITSVAKGLTNSTKQTETISGPAEFQHHAARALLPEDADAPYWKKMISSPFTNQPQPPSQDPPFIADDTGGRGTVIYVIDDGFDLNQADLALGTRRIDTYVVPNDLAVPPNTLEGIRRARPNAAIIPENIGPGSHGTKMATIAGGLTRGVAPNADLYLIKGKAQFWRNAGDQNDDTPVSIGYQQPAIHRALTVIRGSIQTRLNTNPNAKSVINMSWGVDAARNRDTMERTFEQFFSWCEQHQIPVVLAAGNDPGKSIDRTVPQNLGTATNSLITVGGVDKDGKLYVRTSPARPGQPGSMTVFAPAVDIAVPGDASVSDDGTSQAAAIVSGLVAYFWSLPNVPQFLFENNGFFEGNKMKGLVRSHAWTRISGPIEVPQGWPPLDQLPVVYNLARGDPAHEDLCLQKRAGDPASACQISSAGPTWTAALSSSATKSTITSVLSQNSDTSLSLPSVTVISSSPSSKTEPAAIPTSSSAPAQEQCRIVVGEFDHHNESNHGAENWSISIYPVSDNSLTNQTRICFHGVTAHEQTGADVACPPIGEGNTEVLNVRREESDVLRFIWGETTWTMEDSRCEVLQDWKQSSINPDERKRETQCVFDCSVDWSKPPAVVID